MGNRNFAVVDAFAGSPFDGNPAAVVFDADGIPDARMQQIAAEFNLAETAFLLKPTADHGADTSPAVRVRWLTPTCEVGFCGHATLAAVHAWCERAGGPAPREITVECAAGRLRVAIESSGAARRYWLSMPPAELHESPIELASLLDVLHLPHVSESIGPVFETRDHDLVLFLANGNHVRRLAPDFAALERLSREHLLRGVAVASTDTGEPGITCISRFFAPAAGIAEDPTTGSVHGPIAEILIRGRWVAAKSPGLWSFVCRQLPANGRVGTIHIRAESRGDDLAVEVGGECVTVMRGELVSMMD